MAKFSRILKKCIPVFVLIALMLVIYFFGATKYLSLNMLKNYHLFMKNYVHLHPFLSALYFILIYFFSVLLSLPTGIILCITSGYLFPFPLSSLYVVTASSLGSFTVFFLSKKVIHHLMERKKDLYLRKLEKGFSENAVFYLLFLRLVGIFPYWLVNIGPAFFKIRLWTFFWTTFIGIIPGVVLLTQAGSGLFLVIESNQELSIFTLFTAKIKICLILLGLLALLPIVIKKIIQKKRKKTNHNFPQKK